jgi:hypothetical protein
MCGFASFQPHLVLLCRDEVAAVLAAAAITAKPVSQAMAVQ